MKKKCIKYPSVEQLRTIVTNVNRSVGFVGLDENGEAIYDNSKQKPKLKFKGTVKLHGTNFGVSFNLKDGLWFQSRENIITPEHDNAGAAFAGEQNREVWLTLITKLAETNSIDLRENTITIYAEWVGKNIQKNVGVANLEKSAFIFLNAKITPFEIEGLKKQPNAYWVSANDLRSPEHRIFNINDYETFEIEIDFNVPQLVQNKIIEMTIAVEDECPIAKSFGFPNTIGEGIVFMTEYDGVIYSFKSKGLKHAGKSKVKVLKEVDDEKIRKVMEIAEQVTPNWRLQQGIDETFNLINGGQLDRAKLGNYIKWVMNDIIKEDSDILAEAGLEPKDIGKYVSEISKRYFFDQELL